MTEQQVSEQPMSEQPARRPSHGGTGIPPVLSLQLILAVSRRFTAPWRGSRVLSRAGPSGSRHLPWALPRVLQANSKSKAVGGGDYGAGRARGCVC